MEPRPVQILGATLLMIALTLGVLIVEQRAGNREEPGLEASGGWARPAPAGESTAVYLTVVNGDNRGWVLTGARTPVAERVSLHETVVVPQGAGRSEGGPEAGPVVEMRPVKAVAVPAGEVVRFEPGGLHLMAEGLTRSLRPGDRFSVDLLLQGHEPLPVSVQVRDPAQAGDSPQVREPEP